MIKTPFKLTESEILCSAASTLCLHILTVAGTPSRRLEDIAENPQYGHTASAIDTPTPTRFLRITDIRAGSVNWATVPFCECKRPASYLLKEGDLLVARSGSVGKSFLVADVPEPTVFASYMIRIRAKPGLVPEFAFWYFQSQQFWEQLLSKQRGSAMANINGRMLSALEFPLPEESFQTKIAKFLDNFRQRLQGGHIIIGELPPPLNGVPRMVERIEALAAQIAEARSLRQQAAEEADALLAAASAKTFEPKHDWHTKEVGDFCESPQYGYTESAIDEAVGPRFLRITDIQDGRVSWDRVPYCRCPEPAKYLLKPNDLVFARTGATTGKSFVIRDCPEAVFASYLIRLRVRGTVSVDYLYRYFQSPAYWAQIADEKKGTGQPNLNGSKLAKLKVPIPPLPEQRRIVAYLDVLQAQVDALKRLQAETAVALDALLPSVLDRALKG